MFVSFTAAAQVMDRWDWVILVIAVASIPVAVLSNIRWSRKGRRQDLPRDWQSFWLMLAATLCMVAIVGWYLFFYIIRGRY